MQVFQHEIENYFAAEIFLDLSLSNFFFMPLKWSFLIWEYKYVCYSDPLQKFADIYITSMGHLSVGLRADNMKLKQISYRPYTKCCLILRAVV